MVTKALGSMYPWILDTRYWQESVVIPYKIILITEYTILNVETTFEYLSHTLVKTLLLFKLVSDFRSCFLLR